MAEAGSKKGHFCKPLRTQFRRKEFDYRQIARRHDAAIYEKTWRKSSEPNVCYEVIRIRRRDGFHIGDRFVGPAEVYPNSEAWGTDGFTLIEKDAAFAKLRKLIPLTLSPVCVPIPIPIPIPIPLPLPYILPGTPTSPL